MQIVEKCYQQTKNFDKLSFLYLATGSTEKLSKMQKIADARGNPMSRFHNALYANDVEARIAVLRDVGLCELDAPTLEYMRLNALIHWDRPTCILDREVEWPRGACSRDSCRCRFGRG